MHSTNKYDMEENRGQILLYQTPDGESRIEVRLEGETVWLNLEQMAELFSATSPPFPDTSRMCLRRENWTGKWLLQNTQLPLNMVPLKVNYRRIRWNSTTSIWLSALAIAFIPIVVCNSGCVQRRYWKSISLKALRWTMTCWDTFLRTIWTGTEEAEWQEEIIVSSMKVEYLGNLEHISFVWRVINVEM